MINTLLQELITKSKDFELEIKSLEAIESDEDKRRKIHDILTRVYAINDRLYEINIVLLNIKLNLNSNSTNQTEKK